MSKNNTTIVKPAAPLFDEARLAVPATWPATRAPPEPATPRPAPVLLLARPVRPEVFAAKFMALCAIAQHFGRPGTPTDQAWIESLFGDIKAEWPHLLAITDPAVLRGELGVVRNHYNRVRLHAGIGYVTPDDEHERRGPASARHAEPGSKRPAFVASPTIDGPACPGLNP